jgi:glycosyltransferase involved in cell wall biosynthesis
MTRSLGHGGTERQVAELARGLNRQRFAPHVACFDAGGFREAELRDAGVPVTQTAMRSFLGRDTVTAYRHLRTYVQAHGIRLAHTFDHPMNVFGVPAMRMAGVPVVLASQRSHRGLIPPKYLPLIRVSDRIADGIVVNCEFVREHLERDFHVPHERIRLCYNALDTSRFYPAPRRRIPPLEGARVVIGAVSVLRAVKNIDVLVEAFARLSIKHSGLKLLIAGSGPERHVLERKSAELGAAGGCCFLDSTADVLPLLHSIDIFVQPSLSEALSNSLMEAMAAGCCAVASSAGGNPELVQHGETGRLFTPGDAVSLETELEALVTGAEERRRLAEAGARFVAQTFCRERSVGRMEEVYTAYLEKTEPRRP